MAVLIPLAVLAVVCVAASRSNKKLLDEFQEWQTLVGATLGFLAIVTVLQIEYQNARIERIDERRQQELGYLRAFTLEQLELVDDTRIYFEVLRSYEPSAASCRGIIGRLADVPPKDYQLKNGFIEGYSKLSTPSQILLMDMIKSRQSYLDLISERTTRLQFCNFEPEVPIVMIAEAQIRYITQSDEHLDKLLKRMELLERED